MLTVTLALLTAAATAALPLFAHLAHRLFSQLQIRNTSWWLTSIAALCMAVSVFLPNIHISNQTQTFQQHFVGGGMYTACLFIYVKQLLGWRLHWYSQVLALFAWVSALGVAVELLEFLTTQLGIMHLANADTDWDLLANTLGAFTLFFITKVATKHTD